jgi:MFS transporter, DHA1 family, tetracycline resistance protein
MDRKTFTLLLVVFIDLVGFGIVIPILPLLIENAGGGVFVVGVIVALFSFFQFLFSPILGRLSDKYGRRPVLILSSFLNSISYFFLFISQTFWIIVAARMLAGIGSSNISVAQAYIADTSEKHERTKKMALVGAALGVGFIVGPLLGGVVSEKYGVSIAFLIPAVLSFINTFLIFMLLPESNKALKKHIKIEIFNMKVTREVLRPKNMSFLIFLFFFTNLALALIIGVFPLFSNAKFGWSEAQNGYYFGLIGVGSFVTQAFLIRLLLKKFDETQMIRMALVVFSLAMLGIGFSFSGIMLLAMGPLVSFSYSILNIDIQALISLESSAEEQGMVMGVAQSFGSLARVAGPLMGGVIASFNISGPYIASGIIAILILLWGYKYLHFMRASKGAKTTN